MLTLRGYGIPEALHKAGNLDREIAATEPIFVVPSVGTMRAS